uniref:Putative metal tolerance protein B-like n=1 Tax=Davidia involucrata TaxID=16924 RepID=A0A5B7BK89_DAVIN
MEHQEVSISRSEHRLEVEMLNASEEINGLPVSLQLSCKPVCAFSKQECDISDSNQRSKSAEKLCGLIIFYLMSMAVEIAGGVKANSLAVLTDAAHLLTDIAGFSISLFTIQASGWEATSHQSFGFNRLEVLGALVSIQLIWFISGILIYESVDRILHKTAKVNGKLMFAIASFGFVINFIMVVWLGHDHSHHACMDKDHDHDHDHERKEICAGNEEESTNLVSSSPEMTKTLNINIQGAYLHVMADLIQSVGVMIAGSIMWVRPDWLLVDLVCTLIFSVFALSATIPMLKSIFCILMERTPSEIDIASLENGIRCIKGVHDVHDLHVWAITVGKIVLACHVIADPEVNSNEILHMIRNYCEKTFRIHHVTVQIEQG